MRWIVAAIAIVSVAGCTGPSGPSVAGIELAAPLPGEIVPGTELQLRASGAFSPGRLAHWTFGDGTSGEGETVTHSYAVPGSYRIVLDVVGLRDELVIGVIDKIEYSDTAPSTPPSVNGEPSTVSSRDFVARESARTIQAIVYYERGLGLRSLVARIVGPDGTFLVTREEPSPIEIEVSPARPGDYALEVWAPEHPTPVPYNATLRVFYHGDL